jgi:hypothetical protein
MSLKLTVDKPFTTLQCCTCYMAVQRNRNAFIFSRVRAKNGMKQRAIGYAATAALAAALWIVPSVGTRGQGTLGDRFAHPDRSVMGAAEPDAATRAALTRADALVAGAVAAL